MKITLKPENRLNEENTIEFVMATEDLMELWENMLLDEQIHFVLEFKQDGDYVTRPSKADDTIMRNPMAFVDIYLTRVRILDVEDNKAKAGVE